MTRVTIERDSVTHEITFHKTDPRESCAVCGRVNTFKVQLTDTDTGKSGWFCWRPWHQRKAAEVLA